jgi:transposase-like protein
MKDHRTKEQFVELRAKGWSFARIAEELKVNKQTLINWSKEFSLEISNLRAIELEALQEKYFLLKEKRIEVFGERLQAIKEELDRRDLKEIATEKLFDLLVKYSNALKEEAVQTEFKERVDNAGALLGYDTGMLNSWKA